MRQLQEYIDDKFVVKQVQETEFSTIVKQAASKPVDYLKRPILARLSDKGNKQLQFDFDRLFKDSNLRRNKLVLEEIVRRRENDEFINKTSATLFTLKQTVPWAGRR